MGKEVKPGPTLDRLANAATTEAMRMLKEELRQEGKARQESRR
jgi:hypothetical protein